MGQGGTEQGRKAAMNLSNNTQEEYLDNLLLKVKAMKSMSK